MTVTISGENIVRPQVESVHSQLVYVLSSKSGLGHSSRAAAVRQAMDPTDRVAFLADENSHDFLRANIAAEHAASRIVTLDYDYHMSDEDFAQRNVHLLDEFSKGSAAINDFHPQVYGIKLLMERSGVSVPLVGIYHSILGSFKTNNEIQSFQRRYMGLAQKLDYLFLTEPTQQHSAPFELDSGTVVIPCDPVVRRPTLSAEVVKEQLGLHPKDDFVYVQSGGMVAGEQLEHVAQSVQALSIQGLKIVLGGFSNLDNASLGGNVVRCPRRLDGHNVIATATGVISKPGMGTLCEAIASRTPMLLTDFPGAEAQAKFAMLEQILGDKLPYRLDIESPIKLQVERWLCKRDAISKRLGRIPCNGAATIASALATL